MKNKNKVKIFFLVIVALMLTQFTTPFFTPNASAYECNSKDWNELEYLEGDKSAFTYEFDKYYGTHDWVADSALRLILSNSEYRDDWIWLLKEDPYSGTQDELPFNLFDSWGLDSNSEGIRKWASNEGNILDDELVTTSKGTAPGGRKWLHALRYTSLLHGTMIPDFYTLGYSLAIFKTGRSEYYYDYKIRTDGPYIPNTLKTFLKRELATISINDWIRLKEKVFFSKNMQLYGGYNRFASDPNSKFDTGAWVAMEAGSLAAKFLNFKQKCRYEGNGEVYEENQPKYLLACLCLGMLSHYIADLASPPHVIDEYLGLVNKKIERDTEHKVWEKWFTDFGDPLNPGTGFASTMTFPNGGPNWCEINPLELNVAPIFPYPPYQAAIDMAHLTFTGYDPVNNFGTEYPKNPADLIDPQNQNKYYYSAYWTDMANVGTNTYYQNWGKNLLKWAVYYTACSFLWVMDQVKDENNRNPLGDTTTNIEDALSPAYAYTYGQSGYNHYPLSSEIWRMEYEKQYTPQYHGDSDRVGETTQASVIMGLMMSAGLLVPMIALVYIPMAIKHNSSFDEPKDPVDYMLIGKTVTATH